MSVMLAILRPTILGDRATAVSMVLLTVCQRTCHSGKGHVIRGKDMSHWGELYLLV